MKRLACLVVLCAGACVDLDRYAPLAEVAFEPMAPVFPLTPGATPASVYYPEFSLVDFDHDGRLDLVYSMQDGAIQVARGNGPGASFATSVSSVVGGTADGVFEPLVPMDLDGDGSPELVAPGVDAWRWDRLSARPARLDAFEPEPGNGAGVAGAFEGDGVTELWYVTPSGVAVARWDGAHFQTTATVPGGQGQSITKMLSADLDGDGHDDVILGPDDAARTRVRVFWGGPNATQHTTTLTCGVTLSSFTIADIDGDGRPDLVQADDVGGDNGSLAWCRGAGARQFDAPRLIVPIRDYATIGATDFDRDRRPDLFVVDSYVTRLRPLHNDDGQRFDEILPSATVPSDPAHAVAFTPQLIAADLDRDGRIDLAIWNFDGLSWVRNASR